MGRPLNQRYFGNTAGNQIKITGRILGQAEGDGYILAQKGSITYRVDIQGNIGECTLGNFTKGGLLEGQMIIEGVIDSGISGLGTVNVTKLYGNEAIVADPSDADAYNQDPNVINPTYSGTGGQGALRPSGSTPGPKMGWTFAVSDVDGLLQLTDAATINITVQPVDDTSAAGAATYTLTTTGLTPTTYQWELSTDAGASWVDATGVIDSVTYTDDTTDTLVLAGVANTVPPIGNLYRVVMTNVGTPDIVSDGAATLIFGS